MLYLNPTNIYLTNIIILTSYIIKLRASPLKSASFSSIPSVYYLLQKGLMWSTSSLFCIQRSQLQ